MDPVEERDIEKVLKVLDDEKVQKKIIQIMRGELSRSNLRIDVNDLVKSEDFRVGVKSIIMEFYEELKKPKETKL